MPSFLNYIRYIPIPVIPKAEILAMGLVWVLKFQDCSKPSDCCRVIYCRISEIVYLSAFAVFLKWVVIVDL